MLTKKISKKVTLTRALTVADENNNVIEYNDSIIVNTKKENAVIISEEEYNSMCETIYLVSQKGLVDKIKEGEKEDISTMSTYNPNEEW